MNMGIQPNYVTKMKVGTHPNGATTINRCDSQS